MSLGDDGFLADPGSRQGLFSPNPDLELADEILSHRCVVLLGEPGMGKSTELERHRNSLASTNVSYEFIDLMGYGDEARFVEDLDNALEALGGVQTPHLLIDSLDECRRRIPTVGRLLGSRIRDARIPGLRLRVACRTGDWLESLEQSLEATFEDIVVRELAPLRRADVRDACIAQAIDADLFLETVTNEGLQTFATRPLTLHLLIAEFAEAQELEGQLPMFERALDQLLEEQDQARFDMTALEHTSLTRRRAISGHLALIWLLTDSRAFRLGPETESAPAELTLSTVPLDIAGAGRIGESELREVLSTALFSARGRQLVGWAHRSFAEHLAAKRLFELALPLRQLENLFFDTGASDGRLFHQLREVAGWLIALDLERLDHWIDADPYGVLLAGVRLPSADARARLVAALIRLMSEGKLSRWLRVELRHLNHPELAAQLLPVVVDESADDATRILAIDIAEACRVTELADNCLAISLDEEQSTTVRVSAAYSTIRLGKSIQHRELRSLATGEVSGDENLELKGLGLEAAWPDHLGLEEVLSLLEPPPELFGAYRRFADFTLPSSLPSTGASALLAFARQAEGRQFDRLVDAGVELAWEHLEDDDVAAELAMLMLGRARDYEPFFLATERRSEQAPDDPLRRRRLVEAMIRASEDPERDGFHIADARLGLVSREDFPWLCSLALNLKGAPQESAAATVAARTFDPLDSVHVELAAEIDRSSELWMSQLSSWFQDIALDSEHAERLRKHHDLSRGQESRLIEEEEALEETSAELRTGIVGFLDEIEGGAPEKFWELNVLMLIDPDTRRYRNELEFDLASLPGWHLLDEADRVRVFDAAKQYLTLDIASPDSWLGTNTIFRPAVAGYRALTLISQVDEPTLDDLPDEIWGMWAAVIVWVPDPEPLSSEQREAGRRGQKFDLLHRAYSHAPEEVIGGIRALIDAAVADPDQLFGQSETLREIFDERVEAMVLEVLASDPPPGVRRILLDALLENSPAKGTELAFEWLGARNEGETQQTRAIAMCGSALRHRTAEMWPHVFNAFVADPDFGSAVLVLLAERYDQPPLSVETLGESQIGLLLSWMIQHFPPEEDPEIAGVHAVGARETIGRWRDSILQDLVNAGTSAAVGLTYDLADEFAQYPSLRSQALDAEEVALRAVWKPLTPDQATRVLSEVETRTVQNPSQLQSVVVESLLRLDDHLQGELPESVFLWDERSQRPKPEDRLSDFVTKHLRDDLVKTGIVANREVQIQNWRGQGIGERSDILVEATGEASVARLVIETKGCWNPELMTAMAAQLSERYMKDVGTGHGVYLVGWFDHRNWTDDDRRDHGCGAHTQVELLNELAQQADDLRGGGTAVAVVMLNCSIGDVAPSGAESP